jgi:hypothetical protein
LNQVENAQQDDRTDERDNQASQRETLHAANNSELLRNKVPDDRADAANDDIPKYAHRSITVHDQAG